MKGVGLRGPGNKGSSRKRVNCREKGCGKPCRWRTPRAGCSLSKGEAVGPGSLASQPQGRSWAGNRKGLRSRGGCTGLNAALAWKPPKQTRRQGFKNQLQGRGVHAHHHG